MHRQTDRRMGKCRKTDQYTNIRWKDEETERILGEYTERRMRNTQTDRKTDR